MGIPIWNVSLPSIFIGLMRRVTIALAMYCPRMLETFIFSPPLIFHALGEFKGNLDERLGHELDVHGIVLRPVVIMLGQTIGRADDGVVAAGLGVLVHICLISLHH